MNTGRGNWIRRSAMVIAAMSIGIIGSTGIASADSAMVAGAYGCAGGEIDTYNVKTSGGSVYGQIHLYYDSATGKNCAVTVKNAAGGAGVATRTEVYIMPCDTNNPCRGSKWVQDVGNYTSYAGPVSIAAQNKCLFIDGYIYSAAGVYASFQASGVHCG